MQQFSWRDLKAHKVTTIIALACIGPLLYALYLTGSVRAFTSTETRNIRQMYGAALLTSATPTIRPRGDGHEQLPPYHELFSTAALADTGVVHLTDAQAAPHGLTIGSIDSPDSFINWTSPFNISAHDGMYARANEPAVAQHPTIREDALSGGNSYETGLRINRVEHTTGFNYQGGWPSQQAPGCPSGYETVDGVPAWIDQSRYLGAALFASICIPPTPTPTPTYIGSPTPGNTPTPTSTVATLVGLGKTTNYGQTWSGVPNPPGLNDPQFDADREYLWTDVGARSPYRGRTYLTLNRNRAPGGLFTTYNAVGVQYTRDGGATWHGFVPMSLTDDFPNGRGQNQFASLAMLPDGTLVGVWGLLKTSTSGTRDTIQSATSYNGGDSFSAIHTVATIEAGKSVGLGYNSPGGFPWSTAPNVAADPAQNGVVYAVWGAYRDSGSSNSAGIFLSKSTDSGNTWSGPTIVYDGDRTRYQYFPWVQVSKDRVVHVTFGAQASDSTDPRRINAYYVQSTNLGASFTEPVSLAPNSTLATIFMGDYQALSVGGFRGDQTESMLASWTQSDNGTFAQMDRWGRFGTFCSVVFTDVPPGHTFYPYTRCLACRSILSGYQCGVHYLEQCDYGNNAYFRPFNNVTRGQIAKIVALASGYGSDPNGILYDDVGLENPFYGYINSLTRRGVMGGYLCGSSQQEPCNPPENRPYFRWNTTATRGQLSKIVSNARGFNDDPGPQRFEDVPPGSTFYIWINRLSIHGVIGGYQCGGVGEPCGSGRPYFRPDNNITRGQTSKVVTLAFFPECAPTVAPGGGSSKSPSKTTPAIPAAVASIPAPVPTTNATPTPCGPAECGEFSDIEPDNPFYFWAHCLACRNIMNGYPCGTSLVEPCDCNNTPYFRPSYFARRDEFAKIVSLSAGFNEDPGPQLFEDVLPDNHFYAWINRLANRGHISGYPCGTSPEEPCKAPDNRPYYRPVKAITRGQAAKITSNAAGFTESHSEQSYQDLDPKQMVSFYIWVQRLTSRGIVSGYQCGGTNPQTGEPLLCVPPNNLPYFLVNNALTRGQSSKMVGKAFFPECPPQFNGEQGAVADGSPTPKSLLTAKPTRSADLDSVPITPTVLPTAIPLPTLTACPIGTCLPATPTWVPIPSAQPSAPPPIPSPISTVLRR